MTGETGCLLLVEPLTYNANFPVTDMTRPRASLHTLGCRLNQAETAMLGDVLSRRGYDLVPYGTSTDLLVVNTCSVTENAEKDCRYAVRRTLRHSPHAFVAVTGCYAQTGQDALRRIPGIDLLVGNQFKMDLAAYLPPPELLRKLPAVEIHHTRKITREDFTLPGTAYAETTRALLKIQDGCDFMCSFCIIPFARGHERSRHLADVVREAEDLAAHGYKELVLTGVNIGRYRDGNRNLIDLIQRLEMVPGIARIRISSIEPSTIGDDLLEYMASSEKLCRYLHIPLQSGDDDILRAMNRHYTSHEYLTLIETACRRIPDLGLGTDLMVGFPGEDDAQYDRTVQMATLLPLSYFHVFSYSPRPGTAAIRMDRAVPLPVIRKRSRALAELSRLKSMAWHERYIGRLMSVLFEQGQRDGFRVGLTDNFMRVAVSAHEDLAGMLREVTIMGVTDGMAYGKLCQDRPSLSVSTTA